MKNLKEKIQIKGVILITFLLFTSLYLNMINATSSNTIINSTASNPIKTATVEIIGLPNGANYTLDLLSGYVAKLNQTNYTTIFNIPVNTSSLYYSSNTIPYTVSEATVNYKGNIYVLDESKLKHFQLLYTNQTNVIPFYTYFNYSKWNTTITNQIKTFSIANNSQVILGSIKNRIVKYGNLTNGSKIVKANSKIVKTNLVNSAFGFNYLNITNTTVVKANNVFCVNSNLLQNSFCSNETTPVPISVPYYNNVSFQTGKSYYYLNLSYTGKMYQNNSASITINITDKSNSTILYTNTFNSNSLNLNFSYKIPVIDEIEFSIKSSGNYNYTGVNIDPITVPTKINYYLPITFTNYQSSALTANTQLSIGATQSGNIIGFNSLAYKTYENSTLNNIEFFYPNGTLINSWMEGNILNETQNTNLYDSENTLYWVKIGNNAPNFLPADTGTATTNTIYMGFANTITNLLNIQTTGEAPQLSPSYAKYDNGQNVFNNYWNFAGTSLPNDWFDSVNPAGESYSVNNGILIQSTPGGNFTTILKNSININPQQFILDIYTNTNFSSSAASSPRAGFSTSSSVSTSSFYVSTLQGYSNTYYALQPQGSIIYNINFTSPLISGGEKMFSVWQTKTTSEGTINYGNKINTTLGYLSSVNSYIDLYVNINGGNLYIHYLRTRQQPPNDIFPSTTYDSLSNLLVSISPTSTTLDSGQSTTLTATVSGGTSPYTYQWYSGTSSTCTSDTTTLGTSSTQTISPTTNTYYCVEVNGQIYSSTVLATVNPALINNWGVQNAIINVGQTQVLTANTENTGTSPYTYNFLVYNSIGSLVYNSLYSNVISSVNSISFKQNSLWGPGIFTANIIITDSASTPETTDNSLTYNVQSIAISNITLISPIKPQSIQNITVYTINGTAPFYYKIKVFNGYGTLIYNLSTSAKTTNSFSFNFSQNKTWNAGRFKVNITVDNDKLNITHYNVYPILTIIPTLNFTEGLGSALASGTSANDNLVLYIDNNSVNSNKSLVTYSLTGLTPASYDIKLFDSTLNLNTSQIITVIAYSPGGGGGGQVQIPSTNLNSSKKVINNTSQNINKTDINITGELITQKCSLLNSSSNNLNYLYSFYYNCYLSSYNIKNNKLLILPIWTIVVIILAVLEFLIWLKYSKVNIPILVILILILILINII